MVRSKTNILTFQRPASDSSGKGDGKDWLRELPFEARFLAKKKSAAGYIYDSYGISMVIPEAVLLASISPDRPGFQFDWVDSQKFSEQNMFIALLPEPPKQELDNQHGKRILLGPADGDHYD